jgi:alanine dehydrogenase
MVAKSLVGFAEGVNVAGGHVTNRAVAETFDLPLVAWDSVPVGA